MTQTLVGLPVGASDGLLLGDFDGLVEGCVDGALDGCEVVMTGSSGVDAADGVGLVVRWESNRNAGLKRRSNTIVLIILQIDVRTNNLPSLVYLSVVEWGQDKDCP
jgi:hypothetical protein